MLIFTCSKNTSRKNEKYFSIPDLYSECFFMIFSSRVCFWFYFIQIELIEADGAHLLGRWCNSTLPPPITSSASEVTLRYSSIFYLVGFFWFSVTHELCQYIFSLIDLAPPLCVFKHWKKKQKTYCFTIFRFVSDSSSSGTGFLVTWSAVPGVPGCGGLLTQVNKY